jgi:hypothetical protein
MDFFFISICKNISFIKIKIQPLCVYAYRVNKNEMKTVKKIFQEKQSLRKLKNVDRFQR